MHCYFMLVIMHVFVIKCFTYEIIVFIFYYYYFLEQESIMDNGMKNRNRLDIALISINQSSHVEHF